jgi:hypothetical protein
MRKKDIENKGNKIKFKNSKINYSNKKVQNLKIRRKRKMKHIFKITEINLQKLKEEKIDYKSNDKTVDTLFTLKKVSSTLFKKIQ